MSHYRAILAYHKWQDAGMVLAPGCGKREDIERTDFPQQAFRLGASAAR